VDPWRAEREYRAEFADLASEGFNLAVLAIEPLAYGDDAEAVIQVVLREAEQSGIRLIIPLEHVQILLAEQSDELDLAALEEALQSDFFYLLRESPAVLGYVIFDEPVPYDEPGPDGQHVIPEQLGIVRAYMEAQHPEAWILSSWADVNHMEKLQAGMHSRILFMDTYPFAEDTPIGDLSDAWPRGNAEEGSFNLGEDQPAYTEYLEMAHRAVPDVPQWVILQAFEPIPPMHPHYWRMPKPEELRLEVFLALEHGAKGIFYFLYQSEDWVHGLRDARYRPTPLLEEAEQINAKVAAMGPVLLSLQRVDDLSPVSTAGEAAAFTDPSGKRYVFVVNTDVFEEMPISVTLPDGWMGATEAEDVYTIERVVVQDGVFEISVASGDGRLFVLSGD
jgi:hypothetical protein